MKINEVENLVGISRKNIRFYEEQNLLSPRRDPSNSYRDYSSEDVERLKTIKLLRKIGISCERIREVFDSNLPLSECIRNQERALEKQSQNLLCIKDVCRQISEEDSSIESIDSSQWLEKIDELEKGGTKFMDPREKDVKIRKRGAVLSAVAFIALMIFVIILFSVMNREAPLPPIVFVFLIAFPVIFIICIVAVLMQRMKEINKGELYEAGKY
ncbi:MAG: MerR family transcriptional regulator [Sphaerochaetaceae bacterium]|nr:MerR family transcriptional regulator [Sphaerochaetaceae bacterium]